METPSTSGIKEVLVTMFDFAPLKGGGVVRSFKNVLVEVHAKRADLVMVTTLRSGANLQHDLMTIEELFERLRMYANER